MRHVEFGEFSSVPKRLIASHMATQSIAIHKTFAFAVTAVCIRLTNAHTRVDRQRTADLRPSRRAWVVFCPS
ncbi:hypothetical protein D3C80_684070 [compost metagenome]